MRKCARSLAALALLLATTPQLHAQASIEGAWSIVEVRGQTPGGDTWTFGDSVQPSLFIFANGYYSFTAVNSAEPREVPEGVARADLTPEDGEGVWRPYLSNSGRLTRGRATSWSGMGPTFL
jgi:hypothetical protein